MEYWPLIAALLGVVLLALVASWAYLHWQYTRPRTWKHPDVYSKRMRD
jgi:hypothetical protein